MCNKKKSPFFLGVLLLAFFGLSHILFFKFAPVLIRFILCVDFICFVIGYFFFIRKKNLSGVLFLKKEAIHEKKNIAEKDCIRLDLLKNSLIKKTKDYQYLEQLTEHLNDETSLDAVCDLVVRETSGLFGAQGNVILYLINDKTKKLELHAISKMNESIKVKEKTGDLFDQWALRHNQPFLSEAVLSDFRFDPDRIKLEISREIGSVMSVPLATESSIIGVLRMDAPVAETYHADDLRFFSSVADISKLAIENAIYFNRMQALSITDGLTGLYLRRYGLERLKEEFLRAQRDKSPLSFLMIDIDFFKKFNDQFGHMGGDVVLKRLSKWLKDFFSQPGSVVVRYGGEEFCVVLPYMEKNEALRLAESFRKFVAGKEVILRRQKVLITISMGVSGFPQEAASAQDLIRCADDALLKAKREGRNKVC